MIRKIIFSFFILLSLNVFSFAEVSPYKSGLEDVTVTYAIEKGNYILFDQLRNKHTFQVNTNSQKGNGGVAQSPIATYELMYFYVTYNLDPVSIGTESRYSFYCPESSCIFVYTSIDSNVPGSTWSLFKTDILYSTSVLTTFSCPLTSLTTVMNLYNLFQTIEVIPPISTASLTMQIGSYSYLLGTALATTFNNPIYIALPGDLSFLSGGIKCNNTAAGAANFSVLIGGK